uniref:Phosphoinositide interacting regulator of transient receptor potential channels n=1 Tax=Myripristis murdjan TaxID=586833 RepID=A0A667Y2E6_9TELE
MDMLSTANLSDMDPSSQEGEDAEASVPLNSVLDGASPRRESPSCCLFYYKPVLAIGIGALLFGSGTAVSLLYFTQVGHIPYLLGPLFLSVGLMFLVTGLVWIPIIKQSLEHKALSKEHTSTLHLQKKQKQNISIRDLPII